MRSRQRGAAAAERSAMELSKDEKKPLIRRGSFRVGYGNEDKLVIMCAVGAGLCLCMFIVGLVLFGAPDSFLGFMGTFFWLIPAVVCLICIPVIIYGRRCSYYAGEKELEAVTPHGSDYLYYSDISEVIYKPTTLFGRKRGYHVTVVTGVRDFTYRYIFDRNDENTEPKHTPFYILEINSGLKQPDESDPELAAAVMAQFAVMQEKQEDRLSKKRKKKTWENLFDD